jgi:hypothetical protein
MLAALRPVLQSNAPDVKVRAVQCLGVCKRPATIAVSAPDGYTFVFGDLDPESGAAAVAEFALSYGMGDGGFVPWSARPELLQAGRTYTFGQMVAGRWPSARWRVTKYPLIVSSESQQRNFAQRNTAPGRSSLTCFVSLFSVALTVPHWGSKGNAVRASSSRSRGCPRNCKRRKLRKSHWDRKSWEGTETSKPRARRPAVSVVMRGHVGRGVLTRVEPNVRFAVW